MSKSYRVHDVVNNDDGVGTNDNDDGDGKNDNDDGEEDCKQRLRGRQL